MTKKITFIFFILFISNTYIKAQSRILYVIDSVPYYDDIFYIDYSERNKAFLYEDEIANSKIITDSIEIKKLGYHSDTVIFILTKELLKRPNEYKMIQNIKKLKFYGTLLYNPDFSAPYTGSFIEYYINGKVERTGFIKAGVIEGKVKKYDGRGRLFVESEYKGGVEALPYTEFWPNGNVLTKCEEDQSLLVKCSTYTSTGKLMMEFTIDDDNTIHYSKSLKKELKGLKQLVTKKHFKKNENYNQFLKDYNKSTLLNPKSFETYSFLGTMFLYYGELENAIHMLDTAISLEPSHYNSRICRLYCLIFKYEFNNFQTINNAKTFDIKNLELIEKDPIDLLKICQDIEELKKQEFLHECEYKYEDFQGNEISFKINLAEAEKKYCNK